MTPTNHRFAALLTLAVSSLAVSSCGLTPQQYAVPPGSEVAHVRVVTLGTNTLPARTSVYTFTKAETCEGRRFLYNEVRPSEGAQMISGFAPIEAGQSFSLAVVTTTESTATGVRFCAPIIMFTPLAGRYYFAEAYNQAGQCYLNLASTSSPTFLAARRESFERKIFKRGFDESSSWCSSE